MGLATKSPTEFTMTEQHIKLLRRTWVGWQDSETGAPEIDPKRPYGNSAVAGDVAEILGLPMPLRDDAPDEYDEEKKAALLAIHRETQYALQIVLSTGAFEPGRYGREPYSNKWRRAD